MDPQPIHILQEILNQIELPESSKVHAYDTDCHGGHVTIFVPESNTPTKHTLIILYITFNEYLTICLNRANRTLEQRIKLADPELIPKAKEILKNPRQIMTNILNQHKRNY